MRYWEIDQNQLIFVIIPKHIEVSSVLSKATLKSTLAAGSAKKLIAQYGSVEGLLENTEKLKADNGTI